jgi:inositol transport system permease protein
LIALAVLCAVSFPNFLAEPNLRNLLWGAALLGLPAIGLTFVMLTRGIDFSIGALAGLASVVAVSVSNNGVGIIPALLAGIVVGCIGGLVQGVMIVGFRIPSYIMTIGGLYLFQSLSLLITNGTQIQVNDESYAQLSRISLGLVPIAFIIFLVLAGAAQFVLNRTQFGRNLYQIGQGKLSITGNFSALGAYVLTGTLAGLSGVLLSLRFNTTVYNAGWELPAVAAVILGGIGLYQGRGWIVGTVAGVGILVLTQNALVFTGAPSYLQNAVLVVILLVAAIVFNGLYTGAAVVLRLLRHYWRNTLWLTAAAFTLIVFAVLVYTKGPNGGINQSALPLLLISLGCGLYRAWKGGWRPSKDIVTPPNASLGEKAAMGFVGLAAIVIVWPFIEVFQQARFFIWAVSAWKQGEVLVRQKS